MSAPLQGSCSCLSNQPLAFWNSDGTIGGLCGTTANPNSAIQIAQELQIAGTASLTILPGSLFRSYNKSLTLNGIQIFADNGDPVTNLDAAFAPVGSQYSRKDGAPGSTFYVKTSAGWTALA